METTETKKGVERFGRWMIVATVALGAFLWLGGARSDHGRMAAAKASTIQKSAAPATAAPAHPANAETDTLGLQLD